MKIALCSSVAPFVLGGSRNIVEWLEPILRDAGHQVERIYLPSVETPDLLLRQMAAYRWIDLTSADRIICFRPPAHVIPHPHKVLWFIHHVRVLYDLWDTPYREFPDDVKHRGIRDAVHLADHAALQESRQVFCNSRVVQDRLKKFNRVDSEVLYPPVLRPERFYCGTSSDEIVCICRLEHHKRQHLLIEALNYTRSPVRLRLSGASSSPEYAAQLRRLVDESKFSERIALEDRWITEEEKVESLANCLAAAYTPLDEDSYGYPSLEASHASKAILTASDSGGVLELVQDGVNGYVSEPSPQALADAMDKLYFDRGRTAAMGTHARARLTELEISWGHVVERLLA